MKIELIGVTQRKLCCDFYNTIGEISKLNLKYLILREKDLNDEELEIMVNKIDRILHNSNIKLIINSNIKVASKLGVCGIQLSYKDFCSGVGQDFFGIQGVSIHSLEEALNAEYRGATYLIYGHIFKTDCKLGLEPRGLVELDKICKKVSIPVYGIGGINQDNYSSVINVGATGIALMSSLMKDPSKANFI